MVVCLFQLQIARASRLITELSLASRFKIHDSFKRAVRFTTRRSQIVEVRLLTVIVTRCQSTSIRLRCFRLQRLAEVDSGAVEAKAQEVPVARRDPRVEEL